MKKGCDALRGLFVVAVVALIWVAGPIASVAAKVYVDPDGPAGGEYALPLDSARGEASGTADAGVPGASTQVPLFGQGIRPNDSPKDDRGSGSPGQDSGNGAARTAGAGTARIATADSGSTTLPVVAVIAAIVLIGGGAGLIVHRRFPPAPQG